MLNIPFVLMIPYCNNENDTKYLGRQVFPKNKNIALAEDKFLKFIIELTGIKRQLEY